MNRGTWWLVFVLTGWMPASVGLSQIPNPIQRAGRLHGVYWSDGYHTCKTSGCRPLADLPPAPKTARTVSHPFAKQSALVQGRTFYDRFDALNRSTCDSVQDDSVQCDTADCDRHDQDWNPKWTGSMERTPIVADPSIAVDLPSFIGPPQVEFVPPAPQSTKPQESDKSSDEALPHKETAKPFKPADPTPTPPPSPPPTPTPTPEPAPQGGELSIRIEQPSGHPVAILSETPAGITPLHPAIGSAGQTPIESAESSRSMVKPSRLGHPVEQAVTTLAQAKARPQRLAAETAVNSSGKSDESLDISDQFSPPVEFFKPPILSNP